MIAMVAAGMTWHLFRHQILQVRIDEFISFLFDFLKSDYYSLIRCLVHLVVTELIRFVTILGFEWSNW